ncbi:MAG: ribosomal protein L32 [Parcubacteria bacterium C7867-005]|nr:MAG: ribosomal protein L32 [Parcubacteria bacterium C7867-005]
MTVRMRHTRSQTKQRRSHHALSNPAIAEDSSGNPHLRHRMSPTTGIYRGRKVVDMGARAVRKASKTKEKANAR